MATADDIVQRIREAIVGALDTQATIVALTGRAQGNLAPWRVREVTTLPIVQYLVVSCDQITGVGDEWRATVQFSAFAKEDSEDVANALITQVVKWFQYPTLAALASPLYIAVEQRQRRTGQDDITGRSDVDITFTVNNS